MHILHILPHLVSGGAERQMYYLSQQLIKSGHRVDIAYLYEGNKGLNPTYIEKVNYYQLNCNSNYDFSIFLQLIRLIKYRQPDIVQTWIRQMDIIGGLAALFTKMNWLLREPNSSKAYPAHWKHILRKILARFARVIVANSNDGLMYWKNFYPRKKMCIIPNGVPFQTIDNLSDSIDNQGLHLNQYILYAGRLEKQKKIDILIRAISILDKTQHIKLVICGDGNQKHMLESSIKQLNLENKIFLTGAVASERVWFLMKRAKAFVLLSEYEGLPNVLLEAMVCQCPLIVSDIPAHRAFLSPHHALWIKTATPEIVADMINKLINNQEAAKHRARIARQSIEKWSVENMAREYEKVYQWIIQNN